MSVTVTQELTQQTVTVTGNPVENNVTVTVSNARGPSGGGGGSNSVTSATTSNGTADLDLLNVTTATATVSGTLTADHIHGNLAGSVYAHVRAGEALLKGDPVYVSGFNNGTSTAEVSKADASNAAKMPAIGIMDANLAHNATGHMVITGTITDVNTAGYAINAELYVAAGGGMTATPPTARAQPVARVERVNANNGAIIVKVNGLSASDATGSTLVRRDASGGANFAGTVGMNIAEVADLRFEDYQAAVGATFTYDDAAASAHRTALRSGATGDALFTAATPAAARTTLGVRTFIKSADESRNTTTTFAVDSELKDIPLEAGKSYKIEFLLTAYLPTTEGAKARLIIPLGTITAPNALGFHATPAWGNGGLSVVSVVTSGSTRQLFLADSIGYNANRANNGIAWTGTLAASGNLSLEWAQRVSGGNNTTMLAGSLIAVTEL